MIKAFPQPHSYRFVVLSLPSPLSSSSSSSSVIASSIIPPSPFQPKHPKSKKPHNADSSMDGETQFVEIYMPKADVPRTLKLTAAASAALNAKEL